MNLKLNVHAEENAKLKALVKGLASCAYSSSFPNSRT